MAFKIFFRNQDLYKFKKTKFNFKSIGDNFKIAEFLFFKRFVKNAQNFWAFFLGQKNYFFPCTQTCAESHFFEEKSSQVTQKSNHDFEFF
jgi:hypothetical protein